MKQLSRIAAGIGAAAMTFGLCQPQATANTGVLLTGDEDVSALTTDHLQAIQHSGQSQRPHLELTTRVAPSAPRHCRYPQTRRQQSPLQSAGDVRPLRQGVQQVYKLWEIQAALYYHHSSDLYVHHVHSRAIRH